MSLEVDLRVNGEVIGTIRIVHTVGCLACRHPNGHPEHEYFGTVREVQPGQIISRKDFVSHNPNQGAWALIQKLLDLQPRRAWKP